MLLEISQNLQENACARESFSMFSCKFCEISKKKFFIEHLRTTASAGKKVFLR